VTVAPAKRLRGRSITIQTLQFAMSRKPVADSGQPHHSGRKAALRDLRRVKRKEYQLRAHIHVFTAGDRAPREDAHGRNA
jgi:hypothetical protein